MKTHELDQALRRALNHPAPASVHERARLHFQSLAARIGSQGGPPVVVIHRRSRYWWWAGLGLSGVAASLILVLGVFNPRLSAEVEFAGILTTKEKTLFYLVDKSAGAASGWVGLQQDFAGYTLSSYDAKNDLLTLTREGGKKEIRLNDGKVESASVEISGEVTLGAGEKVEVTRATMIFDQENIFPMKNGVIVRITPKRLPDGNILYRMFFDHPDPAGKLQRLQAPVVIALPSHAFGIQIGANKTPGDATTEFDGVGFSFKPKTAEN